MNISTTQTKTIATAYTNLIKYLHQKIVKDGDITNSALSAWRKNHAKTNSSYTLDTEPIELSANATLSLVNLPLILRHYVQKIEKNPDKLLTEIINYIDTTSLEPATKLLIKNLRNNKLKSTTSFTQLNAHGLNPNSNKRKSSQPTTNTTLPTTSNNNENDCQLQLESIGLATPRQQKEETPQKNQVRKSLFPQTNPFPTSNSKRKAEESEKYHQNHKRIHKTDEHSDEEQQPSPTYADITKRPMSSITITRKTTNLTTTTPTVNSPTTNNINKKTQQTNPNPTQTTTNTPTTDPTTQQQITPNNNQQQNEKLLTDTPIPCKQPTPEKTVSTNFTLIPNPQIDIEKETRILEIITEKIIRYKNHISILETHLENKTTPKIMNTLTLPPPLLTKDHDLIKIYNEIRKETQIKLIKETIKHLKKRITELENQGKKTQDTLANKIEKNKIEEIKTRTEKKLVEKISKSWQKVEKIKQKTLYRTNILPNKISNTHSYPQQPNRTNTQTNIPQQTTQQHNNQPNNQLPAQTTQTQQNNQQSTQPNNILPLMSLNIQPNLHLNTISYKQHQNYNYHRYHYNIKTSTKQ